MKTFLWIQKGGESESSKLYVDGKCYTERHPKYASLFYEFRKRMDKPHWDYEKDGTKLAVSVNNKVVVSTHFEQKDDKGRNIVFSYIQQGKEDVAANIVKTCNSSYTLNSETSHTIDSQIKAISHSIGKKKLLAAGIIVIVGILCLISQCR